MPWGDDIRWFAGKQLITELQSGACLTLGRRGSGRRFIGRAATQLDAAAHHGY
jgi:hypothetical protein